MKAISILFLVLLAFVSADRATLRGNKDSSRALEADAKEEIVLQEFKNVKVVPGPPEKLGTDKDKPQGKPVRPTPSLDKKKLVPNPPGRPLQTTSPSPCCCECTGPPPCTTCSCTKEDAKRLRKQEAKRLRKQEAKRRRKKQAKRLRKKQAKRLRKKKAAEAERLEKKEEAEAERLEKKEEAKAERLDKKEAAKANRDERKGTDDVSTKTPRRNLRLMNLKLMTKMALTVIFATEKIAIKTRATL